MSWQFSSDFCAQRTPLGWRPASEAGQKAPKRDAHRRQEFESTKPIPALLHTLFDSSISALSMDDMYFVLVLASALLLIGLTVFMIIKINRRAKLKPVQELRSEGRAAD